MKILVQRLGQQIYGGTDIFYSTDCNPRLKVAVFYDNFSVFVLYAIKAKLLTLPVATQDPVSNFHEI